MITARERVRVSVLFSHSPLFYLHNQNGSVLLLSRHTLRSPSAPLPQDAPCYQEDESH